MVDRVVRMPRDDDYEEALDDCPDEPIDEPTLRGRVKWIPDVRGIEVFGSWLLIGIFSIEILIVNFAGLIAIWRWAMN
jgi:hypothetical protein